MIKVHVLVEGQTEEMFVNRILRSHFWPLGINLHPQLLGIPGHEGGIREYPRARSDILTVLNQHTRPFCTTMLDFYGLPDSWPGRQTARDKPPAEKALVIEQAVSVDIVSELTRDFDRERFIPYVQMHEFEALLFSDPRALAEGLELSNDAHVQHIRNQFQSPEEIDDGEHTAPSKRITALNRSYSKVTDGVLISQKIGLAMMRAQCPHFNAWIMKLEALADHP